MGFWGFGDDYFIKEKIKKKCKNFKSLSLRNIKINFGKALIDFIEFQSKMYLIRKEINLSKEINLLLNWLYRENHNFRSFYGWKKLWKNLTFGKLLRKCTIKFFGKSFVFSYVKSSKIKIKDEYKNEYIKKALKFYQGGKKPSSFFSFNF